MTSTGHARLAFIDLARTLAILMMLQGHTLHAVLADGYRAGAVYNAWTFMRGQTSVTFLLLSGFVFAIATERHWSRYQAWRSGALLRRLRRFGFFLLVGYALHFPMGKLAHLAFMSEERWQSFFVVDVLQCIAVTLAGLQVVALLAGTPRRFAGIAAASCIAIVALTPVVWRVDWSGSIPAVAAAYLSPASGSLFPLFPWTAYVLLGACLGHLYSWWGTDDFPRFVNLVFLGGGMSMIVTGHLCSHIPLSPLGPTDFWSTSPNLFLLRAGLVLIVLGAIAHISRRVSAVPGVVHAAAQESLIIYAVHLAIVYGSTWNRGLSQAVGRTLSPAPALAVAVAILATMLLAAYVWRWCKRHYPRASVWIRTGTIGMLLWKLL